MAVATADLPIRATGLHTYYGASHILRGVDFTVQRGETIGLMGRNGMRQAAELCYHRAHYAAQRLADLPGYAVLEHGPFFKEFVLRCPRPVSEINAALWAKDIIGGYDLGRDYPSMQHCMLLCVTEMTSKAEIDALVGVLSSKF